VTYDISEFFGNLLYNCLFQYDGESLDTPSYSVTKEQLVFTDTHL